MLISSANKIYCNVSEARVISFIYTRNNNGPRMDPWGTPHPIVFKSDLD